MRDIRLYDSVSGELVSVTPGDAIRVEVRTSPVLTAGAVDVASTRPFVLFSFLERYLQREGFGTKFLFDSPGGDDAMYELPDDATYELPDSAEDLAAEDLAADDLSGYDDGSAERSADELSEALGLRRVSRTDVERWVNVCFGADRQGREWLPASPHARVPLAEAMRLFGHPAVAMYLLGPHYSQPLGDAHAGLTNGSRHARRIREASATLSAGEPSPADMSHHLDEFREALADDLDTPNALVAMFEWVLEAERRGHSVGDRDLRAMLEIFELEDLLAQPA